MNTLMHSSQGGSQILLEDTCKILFAQTYGQTWDRSDEIVVSYKRAQVDQRPYLVRQSSELVAGHSKLLQTGEAADH